MRVSVKKTSAAVFAVIMMMLSALCAFADEGLSVNGQEVKAGDTVTYEYRMGGVSEPLEAAGAYIEYDAKSLEYIEGSIGFEAFKNAMYNVEPGKIYYSAIDVVNGYDLKKEQMVVKLSFKVLDKAKGSLKVTHTFDEIFTFTNEEEDLPESAYAAKEIVSVNSYEKNDSPFSGIDAQSIEEMQKSSETDFDALMLGTDKDEYMASNSTGGTSSSETSSVSSSASVSETADSAQNTTESTASEASKAMTSSQSSHPEKSDSKAIVIVIAAVFAALVIGVVVMTVIKKKQ